MNVVQRFRALLADPTWRYPIAFGLVAVYAMLAVRTAGSGSIGLEPAFWAALGAAYLAGIQPGTSTTVGVRTGVVSSIVLIATFPAGTVVHYLTTYPSQLFDVAALLLVVAIAFPIFVGFTAIVTVIGAKIGGWLAKQTGRRRDPPVSAA